MKSTGCIALVILLALIEAPTSDGRHIKIKKGELAELANIWKQACGCLDMMVKITGKDAQAKGEKVPDEVKKEFMNLLKVIYVFNRRMEDALNSFFQNNTESVEKSVELQHWRLTLVKSIEKVDNQIRTLCNNIGINYSFTRSSAEKTEKQMDYVKDKCMGISLCLPNSAFTFEKRFFEAIGKMIKGDIPHSYE